MRDYNISLSDIINYVTSYSKKKILIVSCYREPVLRNMSIFFETMTWKLNLTIDDIFKMYINNIQDLIDIYLRDFLFDSMHQPDISDSGRINFLQFVHEIVH